MRPPAPRRTLELSPVSLLVLLAACSASGRPPDDGTQDGGGTGGDGGPDGGPVSFEDWPRDPIIEPGAPADAPGLFTPPGSPTGGPCLLEPEPGTLFPRAWVRPRFSLAAGNQNLFEIRLHSEHEANDLVVYTSESSWTMPRPMWEALNLHIVNQKVTVSVRGAHYNGSGLDAPPAASPESSFTIAPVSASGTIVYWTTGPSGASSAFKGFRVGEETVHDVLSPPQAGATVRCVGCHSSTPDGKYVAFSAGRFAETGAPAHVEVRSVDGAATRPPFATPAALTLLERESQQAPVFSAGHWTDTDRIALSMYEIGGKTEIAWTNLAATSAAQGVGWGVLARGGDNRNAAAVAFSHDGTYVVYSSSNDVNSGVNLGSGGGDLYSLPYNGGAGGTAMPLAGASSVDFSEHYAAFAADDQLLAFTRVPNAQDGHDNPQSEVFVVPASGGTAVRLAANDPPSCAGETSPGLTNSWPKWSPQALSTGNTRYYWLTFSSRRGAAHTPQLYITAVTVNEVGQISTHPAIYLWNQPEGESNHTPAWDNFDIIIP